VEGAHPRLSIGHQSHTVDSWLWFHGAWVRQAGEGPEHFVEVLRDLGVPMAVLGGLAVFRGAFVPVVCVPLAASLLVSMVAVQLPNGLLGRAVARTGLRMMPTFPPLSLKFRTAGFPQYGFKAGLSDGAFPSTASSSRRAVCGRPSCTSLACAGASL
jgi:uncharacterized membrane protein YphA (DoxX/SURF4 family)